MVKIIHQTLKTVCLCGYNKIPVITDNDFGVPQGSILDPFIFSDNSNYNLYNACNDIPELCHPVDTCQSYTGTAVPWLAVVSIR